MNRTREQFLRNTLRNISTAWPQCHHACSNVSQDCTVLGL